MLQNRKIIIIIFACVIVLFVILFSLILSTQKTKKQNEAEDAQNQGQARKKTMEEINNSIGGNYIGDGFEWSFLKSDQVFVLTVTKNPFPTYRDNGKAWMTNQGVDLKTTPFICAVTKGIDTTTEEVTNCGNTTLK